MQGLPKITRYLFVPTALFVTAFFLKPLLNASDAMEIFYFELLTLALLAIAAAISLTFNKQQSFLLLSAAFFYSTVLLLSITEIIQLAHFQMVLIVAAFAIFIPLNFIIFEILIVQLGLLYRLLILLLIFMIELSATHLTLNSAYPLITPYLYTTFLPPVWLHPEHLPDIAVILFILAAILQCVKTTLVPNATNTALLFSLIAFFTGIYFVNSSTVHILMFSSLATMLMFGFIQDTYNIAYVDALTGLPNRKAMKRHYEKLGEEFVIATLSVDHFKDISRSFGRHASNQVLQKIAKHLRKISQDTLTCHYDTEKFAIIFTDKPMSEALNLIEEIRKDIENFRFSIRDQSRKQKIPENKSNEMLPRKEIKITISAGVAERNRLFRTPKSVFNAAEHALDRAKYTGYNNINF